MSAKAQAEPSLGVLVVACVFVAAGTTSLFSCTTYVRPIACEGARYRCGEHHDIRFCEYVAVQVEGTDCADLGIIRNKRFCVVAQKCINTDYATKDRDCRVLRYEAVQDGSECSPGTPTFIDP